MGFRKTTFLFIFILAFGAGPVYPFKNSHKNDLPFSKNGFSYKGFKTKPRIEINAFNYQKHGPARKFKKPYYDDFFSLIGFSLIKGYQLSAYKNTPTCLFYPVCSRYALQALKRYGPVPAALMTVDRFFYRKVMGLHLHYPLIRVDKLKRFYDPPFLYTLTANRTGEQFFIYSRSGKSFLPKNEIQNKSEKQEPPHD